MVTLVAAPMIYLQGSAPPEKALLNQDFGANLLILLGLAALISLLGYAAGTAAVSSGCRFRRLSRTRRRVATTTTPSAPP